MADDLTERLRVKEDMIHLGEKIAWGSDVTLMHEAADRITALQAQNRKLVEALRWYEQQMCEGFCGDLPAKTTYCTEMDLDCAGCKARAAIAEAKKGDG